MPFFDPDSVICGLLLIPGVVTLLVIRYLPDLLGGPQRTRISVGGARVTQLCVIVLYIAWFAVVILWLDG